MSEDLSKELTERLREGVFWTLPNEDEEIAGLAIEGPGELPYLALFSAPEAVTLAFGDDFEPVERPGTECLRCAEHQGWGVVLDLQTALSHGAIREIATQLNNAWRLHPAIDLRDLSDDFIVAAPGQERAPQGLRRALNHVLSSVEGVMSGWLVLVCATIQSDDAPIDVSNLFVVIEQDDETAVPGGELARRLSWATHGGEPIQLVLAHEDSPFSVESMRMWPRIYPAIEELLLN